MRIGKASLLAVSLILAAFALHHRHVVKGELLALYDLSVYKHSTLSTVPPVEARMVAHAGGAVRGETYTNSRDALDQHYAMGYRVFELDFDWTSDGHLVISHDWKLTSSRFGLPPHIFT